MQPHPTYLVTLAKAYADHRGLSLARVSNLVRGHGRFFDLLAEGKDCTLTTYRETRDWFQANWPDDLPFPPEFPKQTRAEADDPENLKAPAAPVTAQDRKICA